MHENDLRAIEDEHEEYKAAWLVRELDQAQASMAGVEQSDSESESVSGSSDSDDAEEIVAEAQVGVVGEGVAGLEEVDYED